MNLIPIDNLDAPELSIYAHSSEGELLHYYEPGEGVFIAETANVVMRALEAGYEVLSVLVENERMEAEGTPVFDAIRKLCGEEVLNSVPVYVADHEVVSRLTGYNLVRGLWAVCRRKPSEPLNVFLKGKKRVAVLYDVVNPTNVGAIIRSAAALGLDGAVLTKASVNPLTRRSSRVSMGTVFALPWTVCDSDEELMRCLHAEGYTSVAMALKDNSLSVDDPGLKEAKKLAIFLGTEGYGLPDRVIEACDVTVKIPMYHGVDSLNVAAAGAVIFWELSKHSERRD